MVGFDYLPPYLNPDLHIHTDIHYGDCTKRTSHWASSCRALKKQCAHAWLIECNYLFLIQWSCRWRRAEGKTGWTGWRILDGSPKHPVAKKKQNCRHPAQLGKLHFCQATCNFIHTERVSRFARKFAGCVNTPIGNNVFHFLQAAFASTSASCVNGALPLLSTNWSLFLVSQPFPKNRPAFVLLKWINKGDEEELIPICFIGGKNKGVETQHIFGISSVFWKFLNQNLRIWQSPKVKWFGKAVCWPGESRIFPLSVLFRDDFLWHTSGELFKVRALTCFQKLLNSLEYLIDEHNRQFKLSQVFESMHD